MDWDLTVIIGPGPEPARPGPARAAALRSGKARAHGQPGKALALAARIGASRSPPASKGSSPLPRTGPHSLPTARPARHAHLVTPTRRTATLPQHAQDSQAQYGSTSGCFRRIHSARRSRPQIALARLGPAPLTRITHGPNWGNPFVTQIIDLSHGARGIPTNGWPA